MRSACGITSDAIAASVRVLDVIAEMESDAAHHDDFKNLKEGK